MIEKLIKNSKKIVNSFLYEYNKCFLKYKNQYDWFEKLKS